MDPVARPLIEDIQDDIKPLIEGKREGALQALLVDLHPADIAHILVLLRDDDWQSYVFGLIPSQEKSSQVLAELPPVVREHLVETISSDDLVEMVEHMSSDDAADVVQDLPQDLQATVLQEIEEEDREAMRPLLAYAEDTAGGIMATEVLSIPQEGTVGDAREIIRKRGAELEPYFFVYVVSRQGRLLGALSLKDLVLHASGTPAVMVMNREPVSVLPQLDQEQVADLFRRYDLVAVPVVDDDSVLLGRITIDDVVDVLKEEAEEDMARMVGTVDEEFDETSIFRIMLYRLPWILGSLVGGFAAGVLLDHFAGRLQLGLGLVAFVPVIMAMGGNAGSQAAITMVRLLSLREVHRQEVMGIVWREARVGLLLGVITGLVLGIAAYWWRGAPFYGVVVGVSMAAAILVAVAMGTLSPLLFKKLKVDPAIATGPFVTVSNDATGLLIYFGLALFLMRVLGVQP